MKLTARLLMAVAITQFIAVLCGLTLDKGMCLYFGPIFLDLGAVVLLIAGSKVSNGSRPGRIVAALLSLFYSLSAIYLLIMVALSTIDPTWRLLFVFVLGIWNGTNLLLLFYLCDLKSCLPRYSLRTLLFIVLLVSVGFKGLRWIYEAGQPPPFASAAAIEQKYERQLSHLRKLALAASWPVNAVSAGSPTNLELFGRDDIIVAGITHVSDTKEKTFGGMQLKQSATPWKHRSGITLFRTAGVEQPVVSLWNQQNTNGQQLQVVIYENIVINTNGEPVKYYIEFDLEKLRKTDKLVTK